MSVSETGPLFFLIAGEPSGDVLGAHLMRALKSRTKGHIRFAGIGGAQMIAEGLTSLIPIRELAMMGVIEVLPSALRILKRIKETVATIRRLQPVAVVTIDSSGFCHRVTEHLKNSAQPRPVLVHYVAPMVWAWRPHRARTAARAVDHLLTLLPFEPPLFDKVKLPATYVGHPVVESGAERGDGPGFRTRHNISAEATVLCVLPGSRGGEVRRLLLVFQQTVSKLKNLFPNLVVIVPTVETVETIVKSSVAGWLTPTIVLSNKTEKFDAFAASDAALAASGSVSLELAMAGVPMVIAYKIFPPTHFVVSRVVKVAHATLANLLLDRPLVQEFLQDRCTPDNLAAALNRVLSDPAARQEQINGVIKALDMIGRSGSKPPSFLAADKILELVSAANPATATPKP